MELSFRELADTAPVLIWMGDATGTCTYLSRSWFLFTGQTDDEDGLGRWTEAVHPDDRAGLQKKFRAARDARQPYQVEYRVRHRSGEYHWMLDSAAPRFTSDGGLIGYIGSIVDNQRRKETEFALEKSERRARVATEAAGLGIWEWDLRTQLFEVSPRAAEMFGFPLTQTLTPEQMQSVILSEDLGEVQRLSDRALDPGIRAREPYRYRIRRADDGALRWILAHGEAQFGEGRDARAESYIGTFQDITDQVQAERSVQESEARLRLAIEAGRLAVWELDVAHDTIMPSPELNSLFGFEASARPTANEFRGRYAAGELERLQQLGMEAQARGDTHMQAEIKIELPDGSARWLWLQAQAASPLEGGGPRVIGVVMDVTERRLSEERLSVVARELQHRVKNSLAVVQTLAHQSFRAGRSREDALVSFTERLKALGETTDVMTRNDWLDADLREIVQRVTQPYRDGQSDPFDVEGGHVPVASKPAIAIGMALHELCTNALKYGALSVPGGRVSIAWTSGADGVDIVWREVGGPAVERPAGRGFGTRLLERGLFNEREGKVHLDFDPSGVTCRISISGPNPA